MMEEGQSFVERHGVARKARWPIAPLIAALVAAIAAAALVAVACRSKSRTAQIQDSIVLNYKGVDYNGGDIACLYGTGSAKKCGDVCCGFVSGVGKITKKPTAWGYSATWNRGDWSCKDVADAHPQVRPGFVAGKCKQ